MARAKVILTAQQTTAGGCGNRHTDSVVATIGVPTALGVDTSPQPHRIIIPLNLWPAVLPLAASTLEQILVVTLFSTGGGC
ncbi:MAG: hypothetical protein A2289_21325 [Deltaproteobacteria bacterium RIFOXYA12_FULL_58_15]|nr:MAG: hypothetical protein A2289_21325 [Deltaproteobacteria bacterium RIFOXYA12_FULL_58_15]OGR09737.1 MAG: hypothetical protein A2341_13050 [Deltaproteobacteria bacterium RIFOXYB12_FULL_58_9]